MLGWHKNLHIKIRDEMGVSTYAQTWIAFIKGLGFGLLIYHFLIN
jgi:hypothetical protein